ncbi:MAG TPA: peptidylprolyl isomerase [Pseudomonadales bacterium]
MSERITQGSRVTLHFTLTLENGDVVESTVDRAPGTLVVGDGSLLPGFEAVLIGMTAGEQKRIAMAAEDAFGPHRPENLQRVPRARFVGLALEPGLMVDFADQGGHSLPGVVVGIDDREVTVDFNHPLAGRSMAFDVDIIAVEAPAA